MYSYFVQAHTAEELENVPSQFVAFPLDLVPQQTSDVTNKNEQRLVDKMEAQSGQVTNLTNQLVQSFSAAGPSNGSVWLSGAYVTTLYLMFRTHKVQIRII